MKLDKMMAKSTPVDDNLMTKILGAESLHIGISLSQNITNPRFNFLTLANARTFDCKSGLC